MAKKVIIGLSGGIDSSYSAYLLKEMGYEVEGIYLKLHSRDNYFDKNIERVRRVTKFLNIPLHILDLQDDFFKEVYKPFIDTYIAGETPNPCIVCNRQIKFGKMFQFAEKVGADFLATGHYLKHDGKFLLEALDETKDQSYFLFNIDKHIVPKLMFPLGDYRKVDIKEMASKIPELVEIASQKESSEICFVETNYIDIIKEYENIDLAGDVLSPSGEVIGKHKGYMHYTIGKRKGFTLKVAHTPHYVTDIISEKNQIIVGKKEDLAKYIVTLKNLNMFIDETIFEATVKLRYRTKLQNVKLEIDNDFAKIELDEPVFGLAKGQAGVFYRDGKVLGGGWII